MPDVFDATVDTYRDEAGAAAFVAKELRNDDGVRNATSYSLLDGLNLEGAKALDVGCGFGRDVAELRRRGADAYGCDISPALLRKATEDVGPYFKEFDLRGGDDLPFGGDFDLVWCCAVLVHVPREKLGQFLTRLWEGLRPGGRLILIGKQGVGEVVSFNLGDALPRVMVHYMPEDIVPVLAGLGADVEMCRPGLSVSTYGDSLFGLRVRKV